MSRKRSYSDRMTPSHGISDPDEAQVLRPCSVCTNAEPYERGLCAHQVDPHNRLFFQLITGPQRWGYETARKAMNAYAHFLTLKLLEEDYDATELSPTGLIDQVWHTHLLDTVAYLDCCTRLGGEGVFFEHDPMGAADDQAKARRARAERTLLAYVKHFGHRPDLGNDDAWKFEGLTGHPMIPVCYPMASGDHQESSFVLRPGMPVTDVVAQLDTSVTQLWALDMRALKPLPPEGTRVADAEQGQRRLVLLSRKDAESVERPGLMRLFVKTWEGKTIHLSLAATDTVAHAKHFIRLLSGLPMDAQRLIYLGMQLEDGRTLDSYGIQRERTLHLVLRMRGC